MAVVLTCIVYQNERLYSVVHIRKLRRKTNNKPVFEKHVVFVIVYFTCPPLCEERPQSCFLNYASYVCNISLIFRMLHVSDHFLMLMMQESIQFTYLLCRPDAVGLQLPPTCIRTTKNRNMTKSKHDLANISILVDFGKKSRFSISILRSSQH